MSEKEIPKHEDVEIIEERVVPTNGTKLIKIKIKERISKRKQKKKLSLSTKILVIISAIIFGFIVGQKVISKYLYHWKRPHIQPPAEELQEQQLKAGQVYSIDQE
jgi:hypothetical protein